MNKISRKDTLLFILVLVALTPFLIYAFSISNTANKTPIRDGGGFPVQINEILSSNSLYKHEGVYYDWIELYNNSDTPVDISNFGLSDTQFNIRHVFPEGTVIDARGYHVVYCSTNNEDGHAKFSISRSGGEELILISAANVIVSSVTTVETSPNHPMALDDNGQWVVLDYATPGFSNNEEGRRQYVEATIGSDFEFRITEVMAANTSVLADSDGDFSDYVEITNTGTTPYSTAGFFLSDDPEEPQRFELPDVLLQPGENILVFTSGKDNANYDSEIHAPFSLSSKGETVTLLSPIGDTVDSFTFAGVSDNIALGLDENTQIKEIQPSPGFANTQQGHDSFCSLRKPLGAICINEASTSNFTHLEQSDGEFYDWIELRNCSSGSVNLSDYYLTDNTALKDKYRLPDVTLDPGERKLIICSGNESLTGSRYHHANFTLSAQEDSVYIYDSSFKLVDYARLSGISYNGSYGRMEDGSEGFFFFATPTPGSPNADGKRWVSESPVSNLASGVYTSGSLVIELSGEGEIHYTTDGTIPTSRSKTYTEPITIDKTTVLRAVSISPDTVTGRASTFTYLLGVEHTLPVVSLSVHPDDLWSDEKGIYVKGNHTNYYQDWEKLAHVTLMDNSGVIFDTDCGLKLYGAGTRETSAKKSFKLVFRPRYGGTLQCKVFEDSDISDFSSLLLRGGEDHTKTIFRDELSRTLADEGSDSLLTLNDRYSVLYINGEFFGIYAIRESYSEEYCASHLDVAPSSVTIARAPVYEEVNPDLYELIQYAKNYDLTKEENYRYIESKIDLDSLIDWYIYEAYCGNNDIPGNIRYVYSTQTGKWQYCFFDLDWGFVWYGTCKWALASGNQHSIFFRSLIKNSEFKNRFLTRTSELLNGALSDKNILETIDHYTKLLEPEIELERKKWSGSVDDWYDSIKEVTEYITENNRKQQFLKSLKNYMDLSDDEITKYFGV